MREGEVVEEHGKISRIRYESEEARFQVVVLENTRGLPRTVILRDVGARVGEVLTIRGPVRRHKSGELQIEAETAERRLPKTRAGIEAFLGSGSVQGIGPKLAADIVAVFGEETFDVLDNSPERLLGVPGVGKKRVAKIKATWGADKGIREVLVFLRSNGISGAFAKRIFAEYGARAVRVIEENPYRLARDVTGIGFLKADAIAQTGGLKPNDPRRIRAGTEFTLLRGLDDGHVLLPRAALLVSAAELLGVDDSLVEDSIDGMLEDGSLVEDLLGTDGAAIYLPEPEAAEAELAKAIVALNGTPSRLGRPDEAELKRVGSQLAFELDGGQASALQLVLGRSIGVLTGGPGTGKTTIVRAAVTFARQRRMKVVLAAPTGRAAKRMAQATGMEAKTIHRLLEFDPRTGAFRCDQEAPVDAELVIVDEASMLDQRLALALVLAVRPGTSLLLVGDSDQLPSVGAGDVLADIIASDCVPVARLQRVFRQAGDSEIVACAHSVKTGEIPQPSSAKDGEYFFVECRTPDHAVDRLVHIVRDRMPAAFGLDPFRDIQCLTPMNTGALGTRALNHALQQALSPGGAHLMKGERRLHVGDKVMQVRNNYDLEVYNGDIGVVKTVDPADVSLVVDYEGRAVEYSGAVLDDLTLAYAITVHKSQGSEFQAVVLVLTTHHFKLLQRNLLYTAITRARERLVIVGTKRALKMAIDDLAGARRETRLNERLRTLT